LVADYIITREAIGGYVIGKLIRDELGQDLIEYGLLASFLSIAAIAILRIIGLPIVAMFQKVLAAFQ
jgi:Flp pilus assembly pilin Flp